VALIGYTNVGKSTLFNRLTAAPVSMQNRLFDTLDPLARVLALPEHQTAILLDTVGLVRNLPPLLVSAFQATLEETIRAALLVKVLDITADVEAQFQAIHQVLAELGIAAKDSIVVLNKVDKIEAEAVLSRLQKEWSAIAVSAKTGAGVADLTSVIAAKLFSKRQRCQILLPYEELSLQSLLHQHSMVLSETYTGAGLQMEVELDPELFQRLERFIVTEAGKC
jgi:GTP-binding protein HflX